MRKFSKSLVIGLLLAVLVLTTVGAGVVFAQDNEAQLPQQGWCHGSDGVCPQGITAEQRANGVCPSGITNGGCRGCHGTVTTPAVQ